MLRAWRSTVRSQMNSRAPICRVCVIGAGPSGIAACRALHARGIRFDCFEAGSAVGAPGGYGNDSGMSSADRSLHANSSRHGMQFAACPMPDHCPSYPSHPLIAAAGHAAGRWPDVAPSYAYDHSASGRPPGPGLAGRWRVPVTQVPREVGRMLAIVLALAAAAGFGGSDYTAGLAARRASVIRVTIVAEITAAALGLLIVPWLGARLPSPASAAWAAAAGVSGVCGAMALYLGFRHAAFSVASSLSAVGSAALSVLAGLLFGERPGMVVLAGIALALPAIAAVSASQAGMAGEARADRSAQAGQDVQHGQDGQESAGAATPPAEAAGSGGAGAAQTPGAPSRDGHTATGRHLAGVGYGLAAGAGFAMYFIGLSRAGSRSGLWPVLVAQLAALAVAVTAGVVTRQLRPPPARALPLGAATGIAGVAGTACFFAATHAGLLAVTAVITSLYPAVTILLARLMLGERLTPVRLAGLCLAAGSVALIAVGGAG